MKQLVTWMAKGLLAVVPILVTLYVLWWMVTGTEALLAPMVDAIFGKGDYLPGTGLVLVAAGLVAVGMLIDAYVGRWLLQLVERIVDQVPLVKTIYGAVRDLLHFAVPGQDGRAARRVVAWEARPDAWMIGFVTGPAPRAMGAVTAAGAWVCVYFPMSYQIGGYTLTLPERDLQVLDLSVEEAMRSVLTAGVMRR
jgi:uncharacterized membrane protein